MITIEKLKNMNTKELAIWSSTVTAKELKEIVKAQGIKGYSKLKKVQLLEMVLDMVIVEKIETVDAEIVTDTNDTNIDPFSDTYNGEFDVKKKIEDNIRFDISGDKFMEAMGRKTKEKTKEEYIQKAIDKNNTEFTNMAKNIAEIKQEKKIADELNDVFTALGSGLRADLYINYSWEGFRHYIYIYAEGVCKEYNLQLGDVIYVPVLDKLVTDREDTAWFDEMKKEEDFPYTNKDSIYILEDETYTELPLNVEKCGTTLYQHRFNMMDNSTVELSQDSKDWINIESESGYVYYAIETTEIIDKNRAEKGQELERQYLSYEGVLDMEEKLNFAIIQNNNAMKLLK